MKKICILSLLLALCLSLAGCASKSRKPAQTDSQSAGSAGSAAGEDKEDDDSAADDDSTAKDPEADAAADAADVDYVADEDDGEAPDDGEMAGGMVSDADLSFELKEEDYLIKDAASYVTLGDYTGMEIDREIYEVTEEDVSIEMDNLRYEFAVTEEVDRAAQEGDLVEVDLAYTVDGDTQTEEGYLAEIGYQELGPAFDEQLTGSKAGDHLTFTDTFDDGSEFTDWAGKTVSFDVTVHSVQSTAVPELTDEWIKENTEYGSLEECEKATRQRLEEEYAAQADQQAAQNAIYTAMENSTFSDCPPELLEIAKAHVRDTYQSNADMFSMSLEELLEAYGIGDEELQSEAEETARRDLFLSALAQKEQITVTKEDVIAMAEEISVYYGFENPADLIAEAGAGEIAKSVLEEKIGQFLLSHAKVNDILYDSSMYEEMEEDLMTDDSSAPDLFFDEMSLDDLEYETFGGEIPFE